MKLETYYRRLAEKCGTPILEQILLGKEPVSALPETCMPWTGRKMRGSKGTRRVTVRSYDKRPYQDVRRDAEYGSINVDGKRLPVHRYLYMLLFKPQTEFRMRNECGNTLCLNMMHWTVLTEEKVEDEFHYDPDEPWTQGDVDTLLDQALAVNSFRRWEDVIVNPLLMDCPHDMLCVALQEARKPELLP